LGQIPLSATNPRFASPYPAIKGACYGRSFLARLCRLLQLRVFRCNLGQGIFGYNCDWIKKQIHNI